MATPSRRTASRSAPTSARSTKPLSGGASVAPASPTPQRLDDIPIDPALLAEDATLQDDLDAEGEVDDGVGYYIPTEAYYYTPSVEPSVVDAYGVPAPGAGTPGMYPSDPFLDPNAASSSSRLSLPPTDYDIGSAPASLASPLSAMSNGTGSVAPVKRKRGRPPKNPDARANGRGSATPRPRPNGRANSKSAAPTPGLPNGGVVAREEVCGFCQQPDFKNPSGPKEKLVSCTMCGRSGHPCCLGFTNPAIVKKIMSYPWCCIECKPCEHCKLQGDDNRLLFCDGCDRGWHSYCLKPKLDTPPKGVWYCSKCAIEHNYNPSTSTSATPGKPTPSRKGKERATATPSLDVPVPAPRERKARASTAASRDATPLIDAVPKLKLKAGSVSKDKGRPRRPPRDTPAPDNAPSPTSLVVKLRVPSAPRRDVEIEQEPEEQVPYGGILEGDDADTSRTSITDVDKAQFDKSRRAAESRLGGPPQPLWDPQAVSALSSPASSRPGTPGPSKSFGKGAGKIMSKGTPGPALSSSTTPGMSTPTPSMSRPLRDRVLLQQTASMSNVPTTGTLASGTGTSNGRPEKINKIRFGIYDIDTWYQAPYPEEYAQVPDGRLWLCEFCLKYMKSGFVAGRHRMKCKARHPPGDEIYREGNVSVFEVDGRKNKIYCQNLCLLAKMFLDHKTLYYDVEPFLFYVMTEVDDMGARFVGYFSKEKRSPDNNVSCIMTLPVRQRKGWGQLLIDFSYLLSKKEGRVGSPERPLSGLGLLSYKSYWRNTVFQYLRNATGRIRLEDISAATSMTLADIYSVLVDYNMINVHEQTVPHTPTSRPKPRGRGRPPKKPRSEADTPQLEGKENKVVVPKRYDIVPDQAVIESVLRKFEAKGYLKLRPDRLKYTPFLTTRGPAMPRGLPAMATGAKGDGDGMDVDVDAEDEADTTSSETKEIISTPAEVEPEDTPDKIAAGQDKATRELVAALSASPVRNLRKRSLNSNASPEHPSKSLRSSVAASPANGRRRRPKSRSATSTPRRTPRKAPRRPDPDEDDDNGDDDDVFVDADADADSADADGEADAEWGDDDAEGEEDEEYYE